MQLFKIRDGEEGRVVPYRLKPKDMGRDEDGDPVSTCVIDWEPNRPQQQTRKPPPKRKTNVTLEKAIQEVGGLPANHDVVKEAFYKIHGGKAHAANHAWHRAVGDMGLVLVDDKLDYGP
jgi:hypothetical protein